MESQFPLGFERSVVYTGEGKGGPDPQGGSRSTSQTTSSLNTYITYIPNSTTDANESWDIPNIPIILTMTAPPQHKQRYYYIFWSIATLAVVFGQIYVASSYRLLAEALKLSLL